MDADTLTTLREIRDSLVALKAPPEPSLFVSFGELPVMLGCCLTRCKILREKPSFPKPVALPGAPLWRRRDIEAWVAKLPASQQRRRARRTPETVS